jgi:hypothetical protein
VLATVLGMDKIMEMVRRTTMEMITGTAMEMVMGNPPNTTMREECPGSSRCTFTEPRLLPRKADVIPPMLI